MRTMIKRKILSLLLAIIMAIPALASRPVGAVLADAGVSLASPESVKSSQIDGISLTQKSTEGGGVMLERYTLSTMDLSGASYLSIRYYNPTGAPWPFYFVAQMNGALTYLTEEGRYYVYDDTFNLIESKQVSYSAIAPSVSGSGYIVLPASLFAGLGVIEALYIVLPQASQAQVGVTELHFEKVFYYTSVNPNFANDMITLADFSLWTEAHFNGRNTNPDGVSLEIVKKETIPAPPVDAKRASAINGVSFLQKGTTGGGLMLDASVLSTTDLSEASYLSIGYYNPTGAGWPFYFVAQMNGALTYLTEGGEYYVYDDNFNFATTKQVTYSAIAPDVAGSGYMIIPASLFANLGTIQALYIVLPQASQAQVGVTELHFGEIGYYTQATPNFATERVSLVDFSSWDYTYFTGRITDVNGVTVQITERIKMAYDFGDVRVLEDFTTGYSTDPLQYKAEMEQRVDMAVGGLVAERHEGGLKLTVVSPIENKRDDYSAISFSAKPSVNKWGQWTNDDGELEGITFFVQNLSGVETSLCFEIDEYDPGQNVEEEYRGERWSVGIGGRILLYDTVKNQQMLVHADPMVTLPPEFIGWVRIPASCFVKAQWCTWGNGIFDKSRIAQFTVAVHGPMNMGNSFVMSKVGLYYNKTVVQSIFNSNGNSIADNLQWAK